jgi:hypothetical protein
MATTRDDRRFPSVAFTRVALLVLVPLGLLFGIRDIAWAVTLKTWSAGETLTADDLNANFTAINAQLTANPPCRAGFWSLGDGRLCMQTTLQAAAFMYGTNGAIRTCEKVGPGARVCTFSDFRQACGAGMNPYGDVSAGWYGDHAVITSTSNIAAMGDWDDEFGGWNFPNCTDAGAGANEGNNDGPAAQASSIAKQYRCCY